MHKETGKSTITFLVSESEIKAVVESGDEKLKSLLKEYIEGEWKGNTVVMFPKTGPSANEFESGCKSIKIPVIE